MEPDTVLPALPVVVQEADPVALQLTVTPVTVEGTLSLMFAVPGPVPVFLTRIVQVTGSPTR
jgi:hypothetical protein